MSVDKVTSKYLTYIRICHTITDEVKSMCITEYDEERTFAEQREEGFAEGRAEGRAEGHTEGMLKTLFDLVKDGIIPLSDAARRTNMTEAEFEERTKLLS